MRRLIFCLACLILAGCATSSGEFTLSPVDNPGAELKLSSLKGKYVLLDFWATWCGPCHQAVPELEAVYRQFKNKGLEVVSVSKEDRDTVAAFQQRNPVAYQVYIDNGGAANDAFNIDAFPTFILWKDGQVVWRQEGYAEGELSQAVAAKLRH